MKFSKEATYICIGKTIKFSPNQYTNLLRFYFTGAFLKIKKGLELVSRPYFSYNFWQIFFFVKLLKMAKFHFKIVFAFQVI